MKIIVGSDDNYEWVTQLADTLTCEIMEQVSGIVLSRQECRVAEAYMEGVCGKVDGGYQTRMLFRAEPRLFSRMAQNMIGEPVEDEEEVREYATEFFNILCGRFVSEIYRHTRVSAHFYPPRYAMDSDRCCLKQGESLYTLYYVSEEQEQVEFSWTVKSVELLLKECKLS